MRCPDCNKFVGYDTDSEPEEDDGGHVTSNGDGADYGWTFSCTYRRVLPCADCGTELKECSFELTHDFALKDLESGVQLCTKDDENDRHSWDVTDATASGTERTQTTDKNGKPIKSSRYMKTYYGVEVAVVLTCEHCNTKHEFTVSDEAQASSFDELT